MGQPLFFFEVPKQVYLNFTSVSINTQARYKIQGPINTPFFASALHCLPEHFEAKPRVSNPFKKACH